MNIIRILAVDDHEMTTLGYKFILEDTEFDGFKIHMDTAKTYDQAEQAIRQSVQRLPYQIILLDIQLSGGNGGSEKTGEDLGVLARLSHAEE